jgi:hypothetical protein
MPENEVKKEGRLADGGSQAIPNVDLDRQVSLPSVPLSNSPDSGKADSQAEFTFDQKVKSYGEALKTELAIMSVSPTIFCKHISFPKLSGMWRTTCRCFKI